MFLMWKLRWTRLTAEYWSTLHYIRRNKALVLPAVNKQLLKKCGNATNCFGKASRKDSSKYEPTTKYTVCQRTSDLVRWIKTSDPTTRKNESAFFPISTFTCSKHRFSLIRRVVPHIVRSLNFSLETNCENIRAKAMVCFTVCDSLVPVCPVWDRHVKSQRTRHRARWMEERLFWGCKKAERIECDAVICLGKFRLFPE